MGSLLNFDLNRELLFDPNRELDIHADRDLLFNSDRPRDFVPNRDLGFGKRGIVFRGFVCPVCGAQVTETQPSCTECAAVFTPGGGAPPKPKTPPVKAPPRAPTRKPPVAPVGPPPLAAPLPTSRPPAPAPKHTAAQGSCSRCGARVLVTDTFCWNCGAKFPPPEKVKLTPRPDQPKATKEWKETGKDLSEFLER